MRRQIASFSMMVLGVLALMVGFTMVPAPTPAAAGPMLQPSPRPTLQPTADSIPSDKPKQVQYGRVTGTVIDQRTGAPTSGVPVVIGTDLVFTDGNGNYDLWVISGYYWIGLQLRADQGVALQPRQEIAVGVNDTVVVHLFFTSPAPTAVPTPEPTGAASAELPAAPIAPTPVAAPAVVASAPLRNVGAAPAILPVTAGATQGGSPAIWVLVGVVLLAGGGLLQLTVRRARRRVPPMDAQTSTLLGGLLNRSLTSQRDDETLRDLLDRDL